MCYGNPAKSLAIARARMTVEDWAKFEREFDDFCAYSGMPEQHGRPRSRYIWAKWAFLSARSQSKRT